MAILSMTRHAFPALLCAAVAVACSSATPNGFRLGGETEDSGTSTDAAGPSEAGAPQDEAGYNGMVDSSMGASSGDTDAASPPSTRPRGRDAGNQGGPPPGSGADASTPPTGDGGPCTVNLACVLSPPATTGDLKQDCVNRINQFRTQCACMTPLARWTDGEACADMDAQYDGMMNSGHAGAKANNGMGICPWGQAQDECPGYPSNSSVIDMCLQEMWSEGPPPAGTTIAQCESPAMLQTCYEMHGHFINMSNPQVTKVACGFATVSGAIWAAQNFSQ
jgi:hypothetical protein